METSKNSKTYTLPAEKKAIPSERILKLIQELCCSLPLKENQAYHNYALYKSGYYQQAQKHAN